MPRTIFGQRATGRASERRLPASIAVFCLVATVCLTVALGGCQSAFGPGYAKPMVAVEGFDLSRPGLFTQEIMVHLRVENQMQREVAIESVDLELEVNGTHLGSGTLLKTIPLAGDGAVTASVPIRVKTQDILTAFFAMAAEPQLAYEVSGHVRLAAPAEGTRGEVISFDDDGKLTLPATVGHLETI